MIICNSSNDRLSLYIVNNIILPDHQSTKWTSY